MAEDRTGDADGKPDSAPSPAPLPERARTAAEAAARVMRGRIPRGQEATPGDHAVPPHSPDATEDGDGSGEKGRGRSLGKFWAGVEEMGRRLHLLPAEPCHDPKLDLDR